MKRLAGGLLAVTVILTSTVLGIIAALPLVAMAAFVAHSLAVAQALFWAGGIGGLLGGVLWARAILRS